MTVEERLIQTGQKLPARWRTKAIAHQRMCIIMASNFMRFSPMGADVCPHYANVSSLLPRSMMYAPLRRQLLMLQDVHLLADKAYFYHHRHDETTKHNTSIYAIQPLVRGQGRLPLFARVRNTMISRLRQSIESWFNWLDQKTHIQNASKVRSTKGLVTHAFGRFAAAMIALIFNF